MKLIWLLLVVFMLCVPASASIVLVQENNSSSTTSAATVTLGVNVTSGNSVIVQIGHSTNRTISSVTGGGCTFTQLTPSVGTSIASEIWYAHGCTGGSTVVTVTCS